MVSYKFMRVVDQKPDNHLKWPNKYLKSCDIYVYSSSIYYKRILYHASDVAKLRFLWTTFNIKLKVS